MGERLQPGNLISRGNTSDVWEWTPTTVVKLLRPGVPEHWAQLEADITNQVHSAGLPAPATDGTVVIRGRPGIVLQRIRGESMWDRMKARPADVPNLLSTLVTLQGDLHQTVSLKGVPDLASRVHRKIQEASVVPAEDRALAAVVLASLPVGSSLCHGDLHPSNVILTDRDVVVVDWFDAANGHPLADFGRSALLLRPTSGLGAPHLPGSTRDLGVLLRRCYLDELSRRGWIELGQLATWEAVLAVARMAEPVETDELVRIWEQWRGAARTSRA